jgi:hypothetical protein
MNYHKHQFEWIWKMKRQKTNNEVEKFISRGV